MNDVVQLNPTADETEEDEQKLKTTSTRTVGTTADRLKNFIMRVERLEEDKKGIADDIKEVYGEAKGEGFDVKILRKVIALRKKDPEERAEEDELLELYMSAIGQ
ncbi:MAG: DUF2312 domain-containing protein [Alphaproteobacteria bacterium]|nr:DUF2312 domain-containing protein [Alphaproteobacteria bacterium]